MPVLGSPRWGLQLDPSRESEQPQGQGPWGVGIEMIELAEGMR